MVADGLLRLAQVGVGDAQVAQGAALAEPVLDVTGDDQRLLVVADGLLRLAQVGVGEAQVAQGVALAEAVLDVAGDLEVLLEI